MNFIKRLFSKKPKEKCPIEERQILLYEFRKELAKLMFASENFKESIKPENIKKEILREIINVPRGTI